jgi:branched-chain amino acid transport system substrate-binding protein
VVRRLVSSVLLWLPALAVVGGVLVLAGLDPREVPAYAARTSIGESWRENGFTVAVVWPSSDTPGFVEGARLAWESIEQGGGPLAGKIRLRVFTEPPNGGGDGGASRVARDETVVAVLGHAVAEHAVPASLVYERYGILFLTPQGTDPRFTGHDFDYVFRLTPSDVQIGDALARYASSAGLARVGVLYARTDHGESASRQFTAKAALHGIQVPFSRSYHATRGNVSRHDFRPLAAEIRQHGFDAVLVADELPLAGTLIADLVEMGVTQPILATQHLDSPQLWRVAGDAARNVFVASAFDPSSATPEYVAFRTRFKERHGVEPGASAVQGYDAFMLAADACLASQDAAPLALATTIRVAESWPGLFGRFSFTRAGDVVGRHISVKRAQAGRFQTVYAWEGTEE